jgi:hypothetical protein
MRVEVELVDELPPGVAERGFDVSYPAEGPAQAVEVPTVWLTVVNGKADREEYRLRKARINLGRLTDVLDAHQRPIRRNDVAFEESSRGTQSVASRARMRTSSSKRLHRAVPTFRRSQRAGDVRFPGRFVVNVPKGMSKGRAAAERRRDRLRSSAGSVRDSGRGRNRLVQLRTSSDVQRASSR